MTCPDCGGEIQIGSWPFCRGGHAPATVSVIGDEIDEWCEHLTHEPMHFRSRAEKRRMIKATGSMEFVRHVGAPGSDKSPHTQRFL